MKTEMTTDGYSPTSHGVLRLPERILFGDGVFATAASETKRFGRRALLVCDPFLRDSPELDALMGQLREADLDASVETEVIPELPKEHVEQLISTHRLHHPDVIVAIGGGSAIDLAKLLALGLAHEGPLQDWYGENRVPASTLPLIAVPTTAGTGSEVTGVAVLTDPDRALKVGISSPYLIPRVAIVDPLLSVGAPPSVTAAAGADALVHAVEAYTARSHEPDWSRELPVFVGSNLLSSTLALEAIRLIVTHLSRAVHDGSDLDARRAVSRGSLLAGMAFGSAGTHLSHAIQYPIGALTHTAHGVGTGMLLPFVLDAVSPSANNQLVNIAQAIGVVGADATSCAANVADRIANLMHEIGLPQDLRSMGVTEDDVPSIVELSLTVDRLVSNATTEPNSELIEGIVRAALNGRNDPPATVLPPTNGAQE